MLLINTAVSMTTKGPIKITVVPEPAKLTLPDIDYVGLRLYRAINIA